ncbi:MAG: hypothetical protein ACLPUG_17725 [Acidimicrobiales bacterium]|jgi:hypothetical protein
MVPPGTLTAWLGAVVVLDAGGAEGVDEQAASARAADATAVAAVASAPGLRPLVMIA